MLADLARGQRETGRRVPEFGPKTCGVNKKGEAETSIRPRCLSPCRSGVRRLRVVDHPEGPSTARNSPAWMRRSIPAITAKLLPNTRRTPSSRNSTPALTAVWATDAAPSPSPAEASSPPPGSPRRRRSAAAPWPAVPPWAYGALRQNLGFHQARTNHAGADPVFLFLEADRVRQPEHPALGRLIRRAGRIGRQSRDRRDVDQMSRPPLPHRRQHRLSRIIRAIQIDAHHRVPDRGRQPVQAAGPEYCRR